LTNVRGTASAGPNSAVSAEGFLGWIGNCFGYGQNQAYAGQYAEPQAQTPEAPYQGGYGYGPCWAR